MTGNKTGLFRLGRVLLTASIDARAYEDSMFMDEVARCLDRHRAGDFSDMEHPEDVEANKAAIESGESRIFSTFNTTKGKIWIITEWDRSSTTVLFPEDY